MNSEQKLQASCIIQFSQKYPEKRGFLFSYFANSDSAIQGAQKLSLGLVRGVSDLLYVEDGKLIGVELKVSNSSHSRQHLIEQSRWLLSVPAHGFFCDSVEMFWNIIEGGSGIDPEVVLENCLQKKTGSVKWDSVKYKQ